MRSTQVLQLSGILALVCGTTLCASAAAFETGQRVWSKHYETALLAEPSPLAAAQSSVGFAEQLKILEARGAWLRVRSDEGEGWVFEGNIATDKPSLPPATALTTLDAAQTDTVAAARPLAPAAEDYAARHGATAAQADIDWIDAEAARIPAADVVAYMSTNKKGEYRE
jgi:hypothetical protein